MGSYEAELGYRVCRMTVQEMESGKDRSLKVKKTAGRAWKLAEEEEEEEEACSSREAEAAARRVWGCREGAAAGRAGEWAESEGRGTEEVDDAGNRRKRPASPQHSRSPHRPASQAACVC